MHHTYIDAIGVGFQSIQVRSLGDGSVYEDLVWESGPPIPDKSVLDAWIASYIRDQVWLAIQAERDRRKGAGVKVGANWFHSDASSRIQQIGLVMFGSNMPAGIMWKTMGGSFVSMTPTLAMQIFQSSAISDTVIFTTAEQKKAEMILSTVPHDYDVLSGWPLTYGE